MPYNSKCVTQNEREREGAKEEETERRKSFP